MVLLGRPLLCLWCYYAWVTLVGVARDSDELWNHGFKKPEA